MPESPEIIRDDRSDSFFMIGDIIADIAEHHCGIEVDTTTLQRWREAMGLLREFDTMADDSSISTEQAIDLLDEFSIFKESYPNLAPGSLDDEQRSTMVSRTAYILHIGELISKATDPDEFRDLRAEEIFHSTQLLADCASEEIAYHPNFESEFIPIIIHLGRAANYMDSLLDIRRDRKEGKAIISPNKAFVTTLGSAALNEIIKCSPVLAHRKVAMKFGQMSFMRLVNRLKYGSTPYSSLKNIH